MSAAGALTLPLSSVEVMRRVAALHDQGEYAKAEVLISGALGKEVWVLLGDVAHWLWLLDRTDCPWYPTMRLFRPRAEGDWDHVFDRASNDLTLRTRILEL
ncbi:hypothetical protein [Nitrospirillum pindoramense]|uniref:Uncharacterized protein n=1 Tax=Nitrospirillum amazonense TaxID=28077 RepID=A0A560HG04_9PROT|nr:hypothetical protein [Nitrospirillum amazonense]TWB44270.1 hypothetical protein FBZ90_103176 [Nitrospirillum amazonense]